MQITDIDKKIDTAITYLQKAIDKIEIEADNYDLYPREINLSDEAQNYEKTAYELYELMQTLRNMKNMHRLMKLDDSMKMTMQTAYLNDEDPQPILIAENYTVADYDTCEGIGIKFGIDWKEIADYNNLDSMDLTAGLEILIPRKVDPKVILAAERLNSVFDLPEGERIFGTDLPDILEEDSDGDLEVLGNRATFVQGMQNIIDTDRGCLPFYPNYGLDSFVGDDIPREIEMDWMKSKIANSFLMDPRVYEVPFEEMSITRSGTALLISLTIYPVQGLDYEVITGETYYQ